MSNTVPAADTGLPNLNRRSALAKLGVGIAATSSLVATSAIAASPAASSPLSDPIFALIEDYEALETKALGLYQKLDEAEAAARLTHGSRPFELIAWRNYSAIGEEEIRSAHDDFIEQGNVDPIEMEAEYLDAKARRVAAERAASKWDQRAGVAPMREQLRLANVATKQAAFQLGRTKPTTPAGAAALIACVLRYVEDEITDGSWSVTALKTTAAALARMNVDAA